MKLNKPVFVVSTRSEALTEALKKSPQAITIWIRSGKYKNRFPIVRSSVAYEAKSAVDAKKYLKRFITTFCPPKSHIKLSILKEISKDQIVQLITLTKKDSRINKFTHDLERFKNSKTFTTWKKRKKTIYTLTGRSGRLLGIIWFSQKHFKNYKYTLAIRVYPPLRGKGISKKFLYLVYKDFQKRHKNLHLWLRTSTGNSRAIKLYKSFGFKTVSQDDKNAEEIMVFKN